MTSKAIGMLRNSGDDPVRIMPTSINVHPPTPWIKLSDPPFQMTVTIEPPEADQVFYVKVDKPHILRCNNSGLIAPISLGQSQILYFTRTGNLSAMNTPKIIEDS